MAFNLFKKRATVGLALGGGGPKGLAHIGVIKMLEKNNVPIDYIAGTSAGSIVGAFYAAKKNISELEEYIVKKKWWDMLTLLADPSLREGILQGKRAQAFLEGYLGPELEFSQLCLPFLAVAVDIANGKAVGLHEGSVTRAVMASSAIPMVFKPVEVNGSYYVDGGITSPVPVRAVKKMGADIVIAVNLEKHYFCDEYPGKLNFLNVAKNSFSIMMHNIATYEVQGADIVVEPNVDRIFWKSLLEEQNKLKGISTGEMAMEEQLVSLQVIMKSKEPFFVSTVKKIQEALRLT